MSNRALPVLRLIVLIFTMVLALIAVLYVLDLFPAEHVRPVIAKIMAIMGIVTGASLIAVWVIGNQPKQ